MTDRNIWRVMGLVVGCVLLAVLLAGGAQAQSTGQYQVAGGLSSGGGYHLTTVEWQVSGSASGGGYALAAPIQPELRGSGCCCTYLPCVLRSW
jgi:hypothetical protein